MSGARHLGNWVVLLGLGCSLGCGSDVDGDGGKQSSDGPLYVISTGLESGEDFLGYIATTTTLEAGTEVSLDDAVETGAACWIFNRPGSSSIYAASLTDPTIVRWEVRGEGDFVKHETIDFSPLGVRSAYLSADAPIFSAEKSYFLDEDEDSVVIWNPSAMEIIGSIPLGDKDEGALMPSPEGKILIRGDKLVITIGWRDQEDTSLYSDHARVVVVDTKGDEVVSDEEVDAEHLVLGGESSDGTAYYGPYSLYAAYTVIGPGHGATSKLLRIKPGAAKLDPSYEVDMSALVGGRPAGEFTLLDDKTALIRAWHPELVSEVDPAAWQDVLWGEPGFMWWRWTIGDDEATLIEDQEPGALGAAIFKIEDKTYVIRYAPDYAFTDVLEVTPKGEFLPGLKSPGQIIGSGVIRVR